MNQELLQRWESIQHSKEKFLEHVKNWSEVQFRKQPGNGWSASQVLEHILSSETGTLGYMKKKSSSGWETLEITGQEQKEKSSALNARLASPEKYQAPSILPEPTNQYSLSQLTHDWNELRKNMEQFVNSVDPSFYDRLVFRQPIAGMLNLLQTIEFLDNHIQHHIPQLERIMQENQF